MVKNLVALMFVVSACGPASTSNTASAPNNSNDGARICATAYPPDAYRLALDWGTAEIHAMVGETTYPMTTSWLEAGKAIEIVYSPARSVSEKISAWAASQRVARVELHFLTDDGVEEKIALRVDPANGFDEARLRLTLPPNVTRVFSFHLAVLDGQGSEVRELSSDGGIFQLPVIAPAAATACVSQQGPPRIDGTFRAGSSVAIGYDARRITGRLTGASYNGHGTWSVLMNALFRDSRRQEIARTRAAVVLPDLPALLPTVPVPDGTDSMELWFEATSRGGTIYDSNDGRNFVFRVER